MSREIGRDSGSVAATTFGQRGDNVGARMRDRHAKHAVKHSRRREPDDGQIWRDRRDGLRGDGTVERGNITLRDVDSRADHPEMPGAPPVRGTINRLWKVPGDA